MPVKRSRQHGLQRRLRRLYGGILLIGLVALVAVAVFAGQLQSGNRDQAFDGLSGAQVELLDKAMKASLDSSRPNHPFSVIRGGVFNTNELGAAMRRDHVVAAHYKGVSLEHVRAERLTARRMAYVSYRVADKIFWTKNKVVLHQGETILTDGDTQIRARCGNCISQAPMLPTRDDEPEAIALDAALPSEAEDAGAAPLIANFPVLPFGGFSGAPAQTSPQLMAGGFPSSSGWLPIVAPGLSSGGPGGPDDADGPNDPGGPEDPGSPGNPGGPGGPDNPTNPSTPPGNPPGGGPPNGPPNTPPGGGPPNGPPDNTPPGPTDPPIDQEIPSVPEPMSVLLMGAGLAGVAIRKYRASR